MHFVYCQPVQTMIQCNQKEEKKENTTERKEVKTMAREEIIKKIDNLETERFYLKMKDHWSSNDFEYDRELYYQIRELKKTLES